MDKLHSFFVGLLSLSNLSGDLIDVSVSVSSDAENLYSDWRAVGNDIAKACGRIAI